MRYPVGASTFFTESGTADSVHGPVISTFGAAKTAIAANSTTANRPTRRTNRKNNSAPEQEENRTRLPSRLLCPTLERAHKGAAFVMQRPGPAQTPAAVAVGQGDCRHRMDHLRQWLVK